MLPLREVGILITGYADGPAGKVTPNYWKPKSPNNLYLLDPDFRTLLEVEANTFDGQVDDWIATQEERIARNASKPSRRVSEELRRQVNTYERGLDRSRSKLSRGPKREAPVSTTWIKNSRRARTTQTGGQHCRHATSNGRRSGVIVNRLRIDRARPSGFFNGESHRCHSGWRSASPARSPSNGPSSKRVAPTGGRSRDMWET